jgi:hypothetical protein
MQERKLEMPLDFLLRIMRTSDEDNVAMQAAIAAAPYCHPKLSSITLKDDPADAGSRNVDDVIAFFVSRAIASGNNPQGSGGVGGPILDITPRSIGEAPVPVEGVLGKAGPDTAGG